VVRPGDFRALVPGHVRLGLVAMYVNISTTYAAPFPAFLRGQAGRQPDVERVNDTDLFEQFIAMPSGRVVNVVTLIG